jgi:threonine aldolase
MKISTDRQTAEERAAIFARCDRFLNGHGRKRPREILEALAEEAGADELADVYGTGSLIADFEREIAGLLGKDDAVFLPTGTMAQQIALRVWSERAHLTLVGFHPTCHLQLHEQMGYSRLHELHARLIGEPERRLTLEDLELVAARAGLRLRIARFPQYHARALEIAEILGAVPGILVKPERPQTHMMHVYMRGSVDALSAASADIASESRVQLVRSFSSTELPGYSKFELSVGDAAEALSNEEIDQLFRQLMRIAGGGGDGDAQSRR